MKQKVLYIAVLLMTLAISQKALAYDFSAIAPSGQTLYYNIIGNTVMVTYPGNNPWTYPEPYVSPIGNLQIPAEVTYNGNTYPVTSIGNMAFYECSGLTSVIIPNTITTICDLAFSGCASLSSVTIPNSVISINYASFLDCTGLTSVTIGQSVTSIGDNAFTRCSSLTEITCFAAVAPILGTNAFSNVQSSITIYIPCQSQSSYLSQWNYFSNFMEVLFSQFNVISADTIMGSVSVLNQPTCQSPTVAFNATANNGCRFSHWSDYNTDNPRSLFLTQDTSITAFFAVASNDTIHDTTYINVHDTTIMHDTIYLPYFVHDTTTLYDTLYVTVHDTIIAYVNVPVHDTIIAYINVPVHDTVYLPQYIYDTLWLHDTIIIHDTVYITQEGVDNVDVLNAKVYSNNGQIVVDGAEGNTVWLYDATGRILVTKQDYGTPIRFDIPASGTYMIKIGNHPARKVVVIR